MTVRPVAPELLPGVLADLLLEVLHAPPARSGRAGPPTGPRLRVAVDGAPAAAPGTLADAVVEPLTTRGVPALRVAARDFLRPASLRLERGRTDPQAYAEDWLDVGALRREVLDPIGPGGNGRWLPALWDPERDRATRTAYEQAPDRCVLLVDGPLLLGRGLPFDLTVHVHLTPAALRRRVAPGEEWTLPAYDRYAEEVGPLATADVVVRADDPRHPALQLHPALRVRPG